MPVRLLPHSLSRLAPPALAALLAAPVAARTGVARDVSVPWGARHVFTKAPIEGFDDLDGMRMRNSYGKSAAMTARRREVTADRADAFAARAPAAGPILPAYRAGIAD